MFSLRTKLLLAFSLVALLGVGTVAFVANRVTTREFALYVSYGGQNWARQLAVVAADYYALTGSWEDVEDVLGEFGDTHGTGQGRGKGQGQGLNRSQEQTENERVLIVDPQSKVIVDTEGELVGEPMQGDYERRGAPVVVEGETLGTLVVTTRDLTGHSDLEKRFLEAVNRAVLIAVLLVALTALLASVLIARHLVSPLRQLTSASNAMAGGDLSQRVTIDTRDEIGDLGKAFNRMAGDLERAQIQRQQMTADIAHELRNPLSVIRGNLEAMLDGIYPADEEHLGPIYEETMLLQRLVEDLRLLSLADGGELHLVRTEVDLGTLLSGVAESAQAVADDKGVSLRLEVPNEQVVVEGDVDRLRQVIGNLTGNALRYTPEGGEVCLGVAQANGRAQIVVSDSGQGIDPKDLPHIFDRFYRADAARARASGGSGLGLAIVRALVEAHGGTVSVESTPGHGATFTVLL